MPGYVPPRRKNSQKRNKVQTMSILDQQIRALGLNKANMSAEELLELELTVAMSLSMQEAMEVAGPEELSYEFLSTLEDVVVGTDESILDKLPTVDFGTSEWEQLKEQCAGETGESCVICLMEYEDDEKICMLPCNHAYHDVCCTEWLKGQTKCPICKFEIREWDGETTTTSTTTTTIEEVEDDDQEWQEYNPSTLADELLALQFVETQGEKAQRWGADDEYVEEEEEEEEVFEWVQDDYQYGFDQYSEEARFREQLRFLDEQLRMEPDF
eukprot:TRINITY_DN1417_c0_g1_i7.p1 TRINITY_DN1417_c0_g1~~TRINITY_DN1417_c0_g1_i7.p1  ORF type:complete len:270 (-),score=86.23 TRINITY_DN1417_c0_g1_i7:1585-2394(-)